VSRTDGVGGGPPILLECGDHLLEEAIRADAAVASSERADLIQPPPFTVAELPQLGPHPLLVSPNPTAKRIIDVALTRFAQNGYLDTSLQDIAADVRILKGSLYHYIREKQDLLSVAFSLVFEQMRAIVAAVNASELVGLDAIGHFIRVFLENDLRDPRISEISEKEWRNLRLDERDAELSAQESYLDYLRENIAYGQQRGEVHPGIRPNIAAAAIVGMLKWPHSWYRPGTSLTPEVLGDTYAMMVANGLRRRD
jgi:TetR/AcrR family transcriptional regulator, cholesterol catabolism regulator